MVKVDPRTNVAARKGHNHQKPIGQMYEGKAYCGQNGDGVCMMRQEIGKAVHKVAVEYVLLNEPPDAIEQQAQTRPLPANLANGPPGSMQAGQFTPVACLEEEMFSGIDQRMQGHRGRGTRRPLKDLAVC